MFSPEDFQVPLEKQLKMRVIFDDIEGCNEVDVLKASLKSTVEQLMKYQHLLSITLQKQLEAELKEFSQEVTKIVLND
tara:strand:+ start:56 stop:289 length:234 start_codon:yes stop_codon:yes gene_type:complete